MLPPEYREALDIGGPMAALAVVLYDKFTGKLTRVVVESETVKALKKTMDDGVDEFRRDIASIRTQVASLSEGLNKRDTLEAVRASELSRMATDLTKLADLPIEFAAHDAADIERFRAQDRAFDDLKESIGTRIQRNYDRTTEAISQIRKLAPGALRRSGANVDSRTGTDDD